MSLRLELRALAAAITARTPLQQRQAIQDALDFRAWRQRQFTSAREAEDTMERHEGIAEYSGRILAQDKAMDDHLVAHLRGGDAVSAYARSFAYYSGPAYGVLLDRASPDWRGRWNRRDGLPDLLARALHLQGVADEVTFIAAGARHGLAEVQAEEAARAARQAAVIARLRAELIDGAVLLAPVNGASFSFDPNSVTPLSPEGSVYGVIRVAAEWGVLDVKKAALLAADWSRLSVSYPGAAVTPEGGQGEGWTLWLKPGWRLLPGKRAGDWVIGVQSAAEPSR